MNLNTNNKQDINLPLKDRMVVYVGVTAVLLVSWLYILGMGWHMNTLPFTTNTTMDMPMDHGDMNMPMNSSKSLVGSILSWMPPMDGVWSFKDFILLFLMWAVMMIAMMTPSILPMLLLFTTLILRRKEQGIEASSPLILLIGYLMSWVLFSLVITFPQYLMHQNGMLNPMMEPMHGYIGVIVLILAGIYQFTPWKDACLSVCQSPIGFLTNNWKDGDLGAFIIGYRHGFYCIGCCWALMLTLFALGVMNIMWVMVLTVFVLFEKLSYKHPLLFRRITGIIFIAWGGSLALL
ncbi:MAG: hypothetical protein CMD88_05020 [Gammaproteobacteria bacterium]|nr:hypothetical protein [Gammaproteobacteria bacterium]